jgi:hypothetical protein
VFNENAMCYKPLLGDTPGRSLAFANTHAAAGTPSTTKLPLWPWLYATMLTSAQFCQICAVSSQSIRQL